MDKDTLIKTAKTYFKNNPELKTIYATKSGHFFYKKEERSNFVNYSTKGDIPVDFEKSDFEEKFNKVVSKSTKKE